MLCFLLQTANAQTADSLHVRISLITCSPGDELYSTFGHTAIRITDSVKKTDLVYNYGNFDFDTPDFYVKFVRGKLPYSLELDDFPHFMQEYYFERRSVQEQELKLSQQEKTELISALEINARKENKYYKYDFLLDNCTSRVRDLLFKYIHGMQLDKEITAKGVTSRNLIHAYLDKGGEPWNKLGIDLLLGSRLDEPISQHDAMFLPEYLLMGIDSAVAGNASVVVKKKYLLQVDSPVIPSGKYVPLITVAVIVLFLFFIYYAARKNSLLSGIADAFLLYLTGLLGLLLLFMWFGTDHTVCRKNFNLLWAMPLNFFTAFFIWKQHAWIKTYFKIMFVLNILLLIAWSWLPQEMNIAVFPFVLLMCYRYWKLAFKTNK
ncbi:MAG: DUF4105 domain-containing protein [Chitinophagaceae bacterium]|nr:DUF4105 domain-containing protein [Chitinophagaceae bacterium]